MEWVTTKEEAVRSLEALRRDGGTLGFVPTMGALHEGHLGLARASVAQNAHTVMSIFVNPTQFGPDEDLVTYPRDLEGDRAKAEAAGVDLVFCGQSADLYPANYATYVVQEGLTEGMCGGARPVHFRGVLTIVLKLFNIIRPDAAYFGQKDAQQAAVIRRMARDLDTGVRVRILPTVREPDGLAMSSRNAHLNEAEREAASVVYRALLDAEKAAADGLRDGGAIAARARQTIEAEPLAAVEYVELVDPDEMTPLVRLEGRGLLAVAVRVGKTRLIDNLLLEVS